jgi:ectoine hydroxylase-related dioxygenase (phytanoyl-CoA dioxygenase family)
MDVSELARHLARIETDGYTIVPAVLTADEADALAAELAELEERLGVGDGRTSFQGVRSRRVHNLVGRSARFRALATHPTTLPFVDALLGPDALLTIMVSLNLGPGQPAQVIHSDDGIYPVARPHPPMDVQVLFALTDFTEENGATRLVPGSHRLEGQPPHDVAPETIAAVMPKGSAVIYHGSLWHGGGANTSATRRVGLAVQYCAGYLRPQENWFLLIPPGEVATYPPRLQTLLGWGLYRKLLGHVDEHDPRVLLGAEVPRELIYDLIDRGERA